MSRDQRHRIQKSRRRRGASDEQDPNSELLRVLRHQSEYIDHVEKENRILKEELVSFRRRLEEVVRENQCLHDNLRSSITQETIQRASATLTENEKEFAEFEESKLRDKFSLHESHLNQDDRKPDTFKQWTQEMKNVKAIYEAKIEGLQAEISTTKRDLENALNESGDLRDRVKTLEALLKTPSYEGQPTNHLQKEELSLSANVPLIERLTKERDDLMKSVASMRNSVLEAQKVESSLRQDVQKGLAMVEDMNLEKAQTQIENDRLKKDLKLTQKRLQDEISSTQQRISEAAAYQRKSCQEEINEMSKKIGELSTITSSYEDAIGATSREKTALSLQLEEARRQLMVANEDLGRMRSEIEHEVRSTLKGYKGAEDELRSTKAKLQEELSRTRQERVRLEQEASDQQRRLGAVQAEALASSELNVTLTQQLNDALHKAQTAQEDKRRMEKNLRRNFEGRLQELEIKETHLEDLLRRSEIEYQQRLSDLESISCKQAILIKKLKEEGKAMADELNKNTKKYRRKIGMLSQDKETATARLNRMIIANKELEEQVVQHGITHREMQIRLRELDERSRRTTGYAADVAEENDKLFLDKSMLQKEVQFLQAQVMNSELELNELLK